MEEDDRHHPSATLIQWPFDMHNGKKRMDMSLHKAACDSTDT